MNEPEFLREWHKDFVAVRKVPHDVAGKVLNVGDLFVAPLNNSLFFGIVVDFDPSTGTAKVELHGGGLTSPVMHGFQFPFSEMLKIEDSQVPADAAKTLNQRMIDLRQL